MSVVDEPQPEPEPEQFTQFARIDEGLWAWHFNLRDARGEAIASINRAFRGFGREIFTDTGQYFVNFTPKPPSVDDHALRKPSVIRDLTLEERALVLSMAGKLVALYYPSFALLTCLTLFLVNIDFDYFSRHSEGGHGMGFPFFFGGGGED
ncbi:hypothetical protein EW146_g968 [Bondarzewia mesenterica]|uniref:Phospholipid scramblase n=1 Tax=Bondarzewia mesenterica TaxID=1095465 RepID=A0A4S4M5E9_9AGAM|nr:hypothetical protein EW146_g968 [Bondarzewia mesenterica]